MATGKKQSDAVLLDEELLVEIARSNVFDNTYALLVPQVPILKGESDGSIGPALVLEYDGYYRHSFQDRFYNRIHFTPDPLDFGVVTNNDTFTVQVWNAYAVQRTLTAISIGASPDNTTLETALPITLDPFEVAEVEFEVGGTGLLSLRGFIDFTFDSGITARLLTEGSRSALNNYKHNWKAPDGNGGANVIERLRWRTEVLKSENGREQRRCLRPLPLRNLTFNYLLKNRVELAKFKRALWRDQRSRLLLPIWSEQCFIETSVNAGATSVPLPLDATGYDFDAEASVGFIQPGSYETATIDNVSGDTLHLDGALNNDIAANVTKAVPLRRATVSSEAVIREITKHIATATIEYQLIVEERSSARYSVFSPDYYRNLPVFDYTDKTGDDVEQATRLGVDDIDSGSGLTRRMLVEDRASGAFNFGFRANNRAQIAQLLGWLNYWKGMLRPCWVPSGGPDFELAQDVTINVSEIQVVNWDYLATYGRDGVEDTKRDIALQLKDGTQYRRRIVAVENGTLPDTESLKLDVAIPASVPLSSVARVCFLKYCRLAVDDIEIEWDTESTFLAKLRFFELPYCD